MLLVRNDGILAEWEWNNGAPSLTNVGSAAATNDNDGASCGSTSLITTITSVDTWDPSVGFQLDCDSDALDITVTNTGSTLDGDLNITKNDSELTWNENGYPVIDAGATQTWSATITETETGAVYAVTVNPPFGSGFNAVSGSFTYDADCVETTNEIGAVCTESSSVGLVQTLTSSGVVSLKQLDVDAGDYVNFSSSTSLDLTSLGFASTAQLNATAIDPTSGKLFGVINVIGGGSSKVIQLDLSSPTPTVGFIGSYNGGYAWAGAITSSGEFIVSHDDDHVEVISGISSLPTYINESDSASLTPTEFNTSAFGATGDFTTVTLDGGAELLLGYNHSTNKMTVASVDDLANATSYTTNFPSSFSLSGDIFGAAWTYDGDAYFSRNDGGGVFVVKSESIDTAGQSLTVSATVVTATATTNQNDGFGCPESIDVPQTVTAVLTYNANGGSGAPGDQSGDAESDVAISSTVPTRDGYTFMGWNSLADGSGDSYSMW